MDSSGLASSGSRAAASAGAVFAGRRRRAAGAAVLVRFADVLRGKPAARHGEEQDGQGTPAIRLGWNRRSMMVSRVGRNDVDRQRRFDRERRERPADRGPPCGFRRDDDPSGRASPDPRGHLIRMISSAKNVTPSISAAAMIIEVLMFPAISGCRDMLSTAALASPPMPIAAPMITSAGADRPQVGEGRVALGRMRLPLAKRKSVPATMIDLIHFI